ncbi:LOB domain protein, partial [Trifolium pratense]
MFGNAHRLYGVSNILKILKEIDDDKKDDAMKSIIFESDIRAKFRVDGCFGVIKHYEVNSMDTTRVVRLSDLSNSGGDNVMEDNYDEELKLDGGVDAQISTNFDLKQKERLLDGDKLAISDYELNMFIYGRQPFVQKDAAEFS